MSKNIEIVGAKVLAVQISEGRLPVKTPNGVAPGDSVGNVVIARYGLLEKKAKKEDPDSMVKPGVLQVLEKDMSPALKKAFTSFMSAIQAEVEKKEGL